MERLSSSISREFLPSIVGPRQLREIMHTLSDATEVTFTADNMRFDSVDEFVAFHRGRRPRNVKIRSHQPYLTLELGPLWSRLYIGSDNSFSAGVFHHISEIIAASERSPRLLYKWWFPFSALIGTQIFFESKTGMPLAFMHWPIFFCILAGFVWTTFVRLTRHATIITSVSDDERPFLERHSDQIILMLVSALIGVALTLGAQYLSNAFTPSPREQPTGDVSSKTGPSTTPRDDSSRIS